MKTPESPHCTHGWAGPERASLGTRVSCWWTRQRLQALWKIIRLRPVTLRVSRRHGPAAPLLVKF